MTDRNRNLHGVSIPAADFVNVEALACVLLSMLHNEENGQRGFERQAALIAKRVLGEWQHAQSIIRQTAR